MVRNNRLTESVREYLRANIGLYFLVVIFFASGVAAGAFSIKALDDTQKQSLISYMQSFFQILLSGDVDGGAVFKQSLTNNIQTALAVWLLGITVIGIPLILVAIGIRGFIIGFTVGFLINGLGIKGLLFSLVVILPQNLIIIPCLICICVTAISYSKGAIKGRTAKKWTNSYRRRLGPYTLSILIALIVSSSGSLIESYITPVFMKLMSSYLNSYIQSIIIHI